MKALKVMFIVLLVVVFLGAIALDAQAIYYTTIEDIIYSQHTIHAGGTLKKDENADPDDEEFVLEFVYHANNDNSGAEMLEFQLKCFSGIDCDYVYGYGVQILNPSQLTCSLKYDYETTTHPNILDSEIHKYYNYSIDYNNATVNYFNTDDFVSYGATTALNEDAHPYIIKIGDEKYSFDFEFDNEVHYHEVLWGVGRTHTHYVSNFEYFLWKTYNAITELITEDGKTTGVYKNLTMEYYNVFNFYKEENGRFEELADFTYSSKYIDLKVTYIDRGAGVHSDSMFKQIKTSEVAYA